MCINRIRLEFKVITVDCDVEPYKVLIESDWNLKQLTVIRSASDKPSINRIRLEFKVL